ncbi:hypothetical protein W97_03806 [Coniosporium apollinis CBS 100218]|uniref:Core domain-containing protein n=1 Tax=Coniosporium apollinis (strain CBS 100218) TaxID=1168221 RepID=R7YRU7_CONA1|nr:uncharacterized protein W97_03806 [Coniosporium apollinis CBS 100218]EON64573.1 hypothetical protein W97_03806 [Coniosporium apollinis CBS 100218]
MSFPRACASLAPAVFKLASPAALPLARRCPQCLRGFSSYRPIHQSSKRQLQTATAYHPASLDPPPPPPRNVGVPDSSIAGGKPQVNEARPPRLTEQHGSSSAFTQEERPSVSVTEAEAQKSKPVAAATATATSTAAAPSQRPRRSKLRPRKAAMTLSSAAVEQLKGLLDQPEPKLIRVGVKNRGCSGLAYHLEYVDKPGAFDEAVEQDGVKVLVDSKALFSIIGSEMDWMEDKLSARFVFKNPNISKWHVWL